MPYREDRNGRLVKVRSSPRALRGMGDITRAQYDACAVQNGCNQPGISQAQYDACSAMNGCGAPPSAAPAAVAPTMILGIPLTTFVPIAAGVASLLIAIVSVVSNSRRANPPRRRNRRSARRASRYYVQGRVS